MPTAFYWPATSRTTTTTTTTTTAATLPLNNIVVVAVTFFLLIEKLIKGDKNYTCHRFSRCRRSPATAAETTTTTTAIMDMAEKTKTRFN